MTLHPPPHRFKYTILPLSDKCKLKHYHNLHKETFLLELLYIFCCYLYKDLHVLVIEKPLKQILSNEVQ